MRGAPQTEDRLLTDTSARLARARLELLSRGVAARAVAFNSAHAGDDLARLAGGEEVDLVLVDGAARCSVPESRAATWARSCAVRPVTWACSSPGRASG